jgi:hypothetical protein
LTSQQSQIAWQLYRLDQLTSYIDQRLASVAHIQASNQLIQPPSLWATTARQAQHYIMANWRTAEQQLTIRQEVLGRAIAHSYNYNLSLLRALVSLLISGLGLTWLHDAVMPDVTVSWPIGVGIIAGAGLLLHLITSMLYQQHAFTLPEQRIDPSLQPKKK